MKFDTTKNCLEQGLNKDPPACQVKMVVTALLYDYLRNNVYTFSRIIFTKILDDESLFLDPVYLGSFCFPSFVVSVLRFCCPSFQDQAVAFATAQAIGQAVGQANTLVFAQVVAQTVA